VLERVNSPARRISALSDELPAGMSDVPARASKRPNVVSRNPQHIAAAIEKSVAEESNPTPTFDDWLATLRPRFVAVPTRLAPSSCSPAELTRHSIDKSYTLTSLLQGVYNNGRRCVVLDACLKCAPLCLFVDPKQLLGELQLSFLVFLVGFSFAGFEQWKRLVILLCQCESALLPQCEFFIAFIGEYTLAFAQ
jgi:hypothetical protein